jgi:hypothetical protein
LGPRGYAFAIYLIHNVILYVMRDNLYHEPTFGYFLLLSAVSFAAALGIALAVSRSRTLARVLFLIRRKERQEGDRGGGGLSLIELLSKYFENSF